MKKRILTIVLAAILVVLVGSMAFACKPKPKPDSKPPVQTVTWKDASKAIFTSINDTSNALANIETSAYIDATIYFKLNETNVDIRIAGAFDEDVASKNKGLVSIDVGGKNYLTLYTEGGVVYLKEALTQDAASPWMKLGQAQSSQIIQTGFSQFPALFAEWETDKLLDEELFKLGETPLTVRGLIGNGGLVMILGENIFNLSKDASGVFTASINFTKISSALGSIPGLDISGLTSKIPGGLMNTIDGVLLQVLNGTLNDLLTNKITNYPVIGLKAKTDSNNIIQQWGLVYDNSSFAEDSDLGPVHLELGIKNLYISANAGDADSHGIKPAGLTTNTVQSAVFKVTAKVEVPGKFGTDAVRIDAYLDPSEAEITLDDEGKVNGIDLTGVKAYAFAHLGTKLVVPLYADYNAAGYENKIRVDLTGAFAELGALDSIAGLNPVYYYDFDLNAKIAELIAGDDDVQNPPAGASNEVADGDLEASANIIDKLVVLLTGPNFAIGDVLGLAGDVVSAVTGLAGQLKANGVISEGDHPRLIVEKLIETVLSSSLVKGATGSLYLQDLLLTYLDIDLSGYTADQNFDLTGAILTDAINYLGDGDVTMDDILGYIFDYAGFDADANEIVDAEIGLELVRDADLGIGGRISVYSGNTLVAAVTVAFDIVVPPAVPNYTGSGYDFDEAQDLAGTTDIWDVLEALRLAYVNYEG